MKTLCERKRAQTHKEYSPQETHEQIKNEAAGLYDKKGLVVYQQY